MERVKFNCKGNNAPAYSCNLPNDQSGTYIREAQVINAIISALDDDTKDDVVKNLSEAFKIDFREFLD
jgi:hypothetical protein